MYNILCPWLVIAIQAFHLWKYNTGAVCELDENEECFLSVFLHLIQLSLCLTMKSSTEKLLQRLCTSFIILIEGL